MLSQMPERLKSLLASLNFKPDRELFFASVIYLIILIILRWRIYPTLDIVFFLVGGILGSQFLDLAEIFFRDLSSSKNPLSSLQQEHSSLKNVLSQVVLVPLSLFVLTSSGSLFGTGLVLSILFSMLYRQWQEYQANGNIKSWLWVIKSEIDQKTQQLYLAVMAGVFILLSLLFV